MTNTIDNELIMTEIWQKVLEGGTIIKVKDNRTFHILFNTQNKDFILWFMSQILNKKKSEINKIIKIESPELKPLNRYDKGKTLDFIVSVGNDIIVVEMNNNNSGRDYTRNLYYTFHALLNKVEVGGKYTKRHAILINLNWFTDDKSSLIKMPRVSEVKYPYPILGKENDDFIITVKNINQSFYDKIEYNGVEMKDFLWKLFTIDKLEDIKDVGKNIKDLSFYCKELERLSKSKEYCMTVWNERLEEKFEGMTFYEDGKAEGQKIGQKNKEREIVMNMNNKKIDIDTIAEYMNLTPLEVQKIIDSN